MTVRAGRTDQASVQASISQLLPDGRREVMLHVQGMHCGACVRRIETTLRRMDADVQADVPSASCQLRWHPEQHTLAELLLGFEQLGFPATPLANDTHYQQTRTTHRSSLMRLGIALLFGMQVMMLASGEYLGEVEASLLPLMRYAQWLLATPVALYAGWPFLRQGFAPLFSGPLSMDTPVALAITTAYGISAWHTVSGLGYVYFDSVAMFVFLLSIARYAQNRGQLQAADRLRRLSSSQPLTAQRQDDDGLHEVSVEALQAGDLVWVAPGGILPADGVLMLTAELDESLITGESLPQRRKAGEDVLAGSVNLSMNTLVLTVSIDSAGNKLSQIARLVQKAQCERPPFDHVVRRISRYFVAVVLLLAAFTAWYWRANPQVALEALLAVLVVTCPCALSLAIPTTLAAAVTRLGRHGILLVHADALLKLEKVSDVCLDKTGTLTTRELTIADTRLLSTDVSLSTCQRMAAQLEAGLQHPIARAFTEAYKNVNVAGHREVVPGVGVRGQINGRSYSLMSTRDDSADGLRWFSLRDDAQCVLAHFGLKETLRPSAPAAVVALNAQKLGVHLLSGDQSDSAQRLAQELGISQVFATQTPADKLEYVRKLQANHACVMAVGDGVNDGPLLAGADVSVGLVSGTALAQSQGDVILINEDLGGLPILTDVARLSGRIIRQNFAWALVYNLTMVPFAMAGWLSPWMAALGMGASSVVVTVNALRLLRVATPKTLATPLLHGQTV